MGCVGWAEETGLGAAFTGGGCCGAGCTVMVWPLLLKLANKGTEPAMAISALPLLSEKLAEAMEGLENVSTGEPGGSTGSWVKTSMSLPGSVEMEGFTRAVKLISRAFGGLFLICAVKWTPASPMKRRRAAS